MRWGSLGPDGMVFAMGSFFHVGNADAMIEKCACAGGELGYAVVAMSKGVAVVWDGRM
jgi:hypothetical protein